MGTLPAVAKAVRVDFHFSEAADPNVQIREFFQYSGTLSLADAATWLHNGMVALGSFMGTFMQPTISLVSGELTDLTSTSAPQVVDSTGATGGAGAGPLAAGVALVVKKHISRRYRGGHPRVYLPGMSGAYLTSPTQWNPTSLTNIVNAYATVIATLVNNATIPTVGTITHINISYYSGFTNHTYPSGRVKAIPTPRVTPLVDTITSISGNPTPGSQRRRNEQP